MRKLLSGTLLATLLASAAVAAEPGECPVFTQGKQIQVLNYVRSRYEFTSSTNLRVVSSELLSDSCYRKLVLSVDKPASRTFPIYLSEDGNYLIPVLLDLNTDPEEEKRIVARQVSRALLSDPSPSLGGADRPVTIVEFSDFQCPYCRRFSDMFESLAQAQKDKVRLIFKEYPLQMHKWARRAAELAACSGLQRDRAFWDADRFFFRSQKEITSENIDSKFTEFAKTDAEIDVNGLNGCLAAHAADAVLNRDAALANSLSVTGTPTVFVDGRRVTVRTLNELSDLIDTAEARALGQHTSAAGNIPSR
ncbi:MAG: thioredoxin domain-containing protein [Acidobacteriaceae bacterium]|nr:thioredoxin domain-containing protein [Acidobacteriaceae bacterium]